MFEQVQQLHAIISLSDQFHVLFHSQGSFHTRPEKGVIISNGYLNGLIQLRSFHTIMYLTSGYRNLPVNSLQNEAKIAILTIEKLRNYFIAEYTQKRR